MSSPLAKSEKLVRQVEQLELQLEELEAVRSEDLIAEPLPKTEAAFPLGVAPEPDVSLASRTSAARD